MIQARLHRWSLRGAAALLVFSGAPDAARADAPHDITGSMRLWLDGLDVYGTDTGNGGGTNPGSGASVTGWKDKSANAYTAGDATDFGGYAHSYPTYSASGGVYFDGTSNVLEIPSGIYGLGATISQSEIFLMASTTTLGSSFVFYSGPQYNSYYRMSVHLPWGPFTASVWDHGYTGTPGRIVANWTSSLNQAYLYNFGATAGSAQNITQDGVLLASATNSSSYAQAAGDLFLLGGAEIGSGFFHNGTISELIVYSRRLNTAEKNIIQSYLAAKYANSGGAGTANKFTVAGNYRYHVGGIGQESDGSLTTGTSAGLTIANSTLLGTGRYFLVGVDALTPATGATTADIPTGYLSRSQRIWNATRTGGGTGKVTMTFNLTKLGVTATSGNQLAVLYRSGTTGAFSALATASYTSGNTIAFSVTNPASGYYTLGLQIGVPALAASLANATQSDGVSGGNPKALPGALIKASVTVTNNGTGSADSNSTIVSLPIPANAKFFVGDLGSAGSGPVLFTQGSPSSGLSYTFTSLSSTTDRIDFSNDSGATWTYTPTADAEQADSAITTVRVRPSGTFTNSASSPYPNFTVSYGLVVK